MMIVCLLLMMEWRHSTSAPGLLCHPGTYVHTTRNNNSICQHCPDGTFMPDSLHTLKTCYNCTQIQDQNLEFLLTECSKTHDAEILCTSGYYRRRARNVREVDRCEKCYECEHPTLPCQDYHDTVCCGHTNYDAVLNKDGVYECKERPILCDLGQFLNPETEECTPCPPGRFMSEVQHDNKACRPCTTVSDLEAHETILQACTSTQQANIGCEDGYFRNSSGNLSDEVRCLPCQKCEYQGRECDMYHDTVCCDHPDMIVVNTRSGYQCKNHRTTTSSTQPSDFLQRGSNKEEYNQAGCGENEYANFRDGTIVCLPCERGTYMDTSNHTERVCKNCSQILGSHATVCCQVLTEYVDKAETDWKHKILISVNVISLVVMAWMSHYFVKLRFQMKKLHGSDNKKQSENSEEAVEFMDWHKPSGDTNFSVQLPDTLQINGDSELIIELFNALKRSKNIDLSIKLLDKLKNISDKDLIVKLFEMFQQNKDIDLIVELLDKLNRNGHITLIIKLFNHLKQNDDKYLTDQILKKLKIIWDNNLIQDISGDSSLTDVKKENKYDKANDNRHITFMNIERM